MQNPNGTRMGKIAPSRAVGWSIIAAFVVVEVLLLLFVNLGLFPSPVLRGLSRSTGGLLNGTLLAGLLNLLVVIGLIVLGLGKLSPGEIGLSRRLIPRALAVTVGIWLLTQGLLLLLGLVMTGTVSLNPEWSRYGWSVMVGMLLGQVFGNSLFEEIAFRGFLLPQLYLKNNAVSARVRLAQAIAVALIIFTLMHIPNQIMQVVYLHAPVEDLALNFLMIALWTLFLTAIYLVTGNLFMAVGIHVLIDAPTALVAPVFPSQLAMAIIVIGIYVVSRRRAGRVSAPNAPRVEAGRATG